MKRYTYLIAILLFASTGFAQSHFNVAWSGFGNDHMNIYVIDAKLGGISLEAGDEIAAFDGNICCGKITLTKPIVTSENSTFAAIVTSSKDDGFSNGYTSGNPITYKFWDSGNSAEISGIVAEYYLKNGQVTSEPVFTPNATALVKLSFATPVNLAPVANAGSAQTINEGDVVTLDGSDSVDPDGTIVSFSWSLLSGPTGGAIIQNPDSETTLVSFSAIGSYSFSLTVTDNQGATDNTTITVTVIPPGTNIPPVAQATATPSNLVLNSGQTSTAQLNGSDSVDPDGTIVSFSWSLLSGPTGGATIQNPDNETTLVSFTSVGSYLFELTVTDNQGATDNTTITVTVIPPGTNVPPVAQATATPSNLVLNSGQTSTAQLDGSGSVDPDGSIVSFSWSLLSGPTGGVTIQNPDNETTLVSFTSVGSYLFELTVTDNQGATDNTTITVTVIPPGTNNPPTANAGSNQVVTEGVLVTLDGTASSDPDGDQLTYLWTAPAGITLSSATADKPTFTAPVVIGESNFIFSLVVNDGTASSSADEVVITVKRPVSPNKPIADAGPDQSVNERNLVTLDGTGSSSQENCYVDYHWTCPAEINPGATYITRVTISGPQTTTTTDHLVSLKIEDGSVPAIPDNSLKFQWVIPAGVTLSPKIIAKVTIITPLDPSDKNCTFSLIVFDGSTSNEPGNGTPIYVNIPATKIPLVSTTTISLTVTSPEPTPPADYTISMLVYDASGSLDPEHGAPIYLWIPPTPVKLGSPNISRLAITAPEGPSDPDYNFSLQICDGTGTPTPLTYRWIAPSGITLSSDTDAKPTFIAPEVDSDTDYTFSLVVNDGKSDSPPDQVVITVKNTSVNSAPVANAGGDQTVDEGSVAYLDGSASSDPDNEALTFLWTAPSGIVLSSTSAKKPSFTAPKVTSDTDYTFTLVVNDGQLDSPANEVIITTKQINQVPEANSGTLQSVNEFALVTLDGSASIDADGDILTYSWTAPAGISISSTSAEKPTFTAPEVGTDTEYVFSLVVNDGIADSPADEVKITVLNIDRAPYVKSPIDDISVEVQLPDKIIDLNAIFADDDLGDVLTFSLTSNENDQIVQAFISGSNLALSFSSENNGSSEIEIAASSNGKEVATKFKVEVNIPTQINPLSDDANVQIYPNPTKGQVKIEFSHIPVSGSRITVYDITGKIVHNSLAVDKIESLNMKGNPQGLYFIKIDQKVPKTYKLVVLE